MHRGSIGESTLATYTCAHNSKCTCFHFLLIFRLTDRDKNSTRLAPARQPSRLLAVLG